MKIRGHGHDREKQRIVCYDSHRPRSHTNYLKIYFEISVFLLLEIISVGKLEWLLRRRNIRKGSRNCRVCQRSTTSLFIDRSRRYVPRYLDS